jgi:hypothetical protein
MRDYLPKSMSTEFYLYFLDGSALSIHCRAGEDHR